MFLFERYQPDYYWFSNVSIGRNFFIGLFPCIFGEDEVDVTILMMTLTLIIALVALVWFKPRNKPSQNYLDTFISLVQLTILAFGVTSADGTELRGSLSAACLLFIILVVVAVVSLI